MHIYACLLQASYLPCIHMSLSRHRCRCPRLLTNVPLHPGKPQLATTSMENNHVPQSCLEELFFTWEMLTLSAAGASSCLSCVPGYLHSVWVRGGLHGQNVPGLQVQVTRITWHSMKYTYNCICGPTIARRAQHRQTWRMPPPANTDARSKTARGPRPGADEGTMLKEAETPPERTHTQ
jgi:hypothetical protein